MTDSLFDLSGQRALITGSSTGIGFALARGLAERGAHVVLNARNPERLADAAAQLESDGLKVSTSIFDVTDSAAVTSAVETLETEGDLNILINNAGMQFRTPLEDYPEEMFDTLLRTNVTSAFLVGKAVARYMILRGGGKIVNIASVQAELARPGIASRHGHRLGPIWIAGQRDCARLFQDTA